MPRHFRKNQYNNQQKINKKPTENQQKTKKTPTKNFDQHLIQQRIPLTLVNAGEKENYGVTRSELIVLIQYTKVYRHGDIIQILGLRGPSLVRALTSLAGLQLLFLDRGEYRSGGGGVTDVGHDGAEHQGKQPHPALQLPLSSSEC